MLFVVLGLPVRRVRSMVAHAAMALAAAGVPTDVVESDGLVSFTTHGLSSRASNTLVLVTYANRDWVSVLRGADVPFAYLHADPMLFVTEQKDHLDAARNSMMRLASFVELQRGLKCISIDTETTSAFRKLIDVASENLRCSAPVDLSEDGVVSDETSPDLDGELGATLKAAVRGFDVIRDGRRPTSVLTSRLLFHDATRDAAAVDRAIDVTGRPRILFYGPYGYLPSGVWRARLVVSFSEELVGQTFQLAIAAGYGADPLGEMSFTVEVPGRRDLVLDFRSEDSSAPIELRFSSQRGVFDGSLSLGYVEFSVVQPDTQSIVAPSLTGSIAP